MSIMGPVKVVGENVLMLDDVRKYATKDTHV